MAVFQLLNTSCEEGLYWEVSTSLKWGWDLFSDHIINQWGETIYLAPHPWLAWLKEVESITECLSCSAPNHESFLKMCVWLRLNLKIASYSDNQLTAQQRCSLLACNKFGIDVHKRKQRHILTLFYSQS